MKIPNQPVYLKSNVVSEPLFDGWYAWPHLISPATAALNVKERHLKIMNSYIKAPQIHAAAVKNPKMLGGPFIDLGGKRVDEIKALAQSITTNRTDLLELADALVELDTMLKSEATGYSMEPLYEKIPERLAGYVELYYDLNNNPGFRLFEALLYHSEYYVEEAQSLAVYTIDDDHRPFILSTPRLEEEHILHLEIPFKHKGIDMLFEMQRTPGSYQEVKDLLEITPEQEPLFENLFTTESASTYVPYTGEGIRTRYFGHACILVESSEISILVDPLISYGYDSEVSRYTYSDLPDVIDYVLITHNHQDHILFETLLQLRHKIGQIIVPSSSNGNLQDPDLKLMFKALGFSNVIELKELERIDVKGCSITGIPFVGEHADLDIRSKLCYQVGLHNEFSLMFAADSCNIEPKLYERVHNIVGDIDVLFLGMECDGAPLSWLYGPLLPQPIAKDKDLTRRLSGSNFERGMNIVNCFNAAEVFVYAMGMEPWLEFISSLKYTAESHPIVASGKLIETCLSQGVAAERLFGQKVIEYINRPSIAEGAAYASTVEL
jgi:L-ascorbate metabolism protein UlaG (beta-lactamase superfamily)